MKIYAIRNKKTNDFVRLGRAKRFIWNQFPTNVMQHNIPAEELDGYLVDLFDLNAIEPTRTFTTKRKKVK
ncbi:hypothetical protein HGH93_23560 [Chitinophaga polysaccharea]|nr:hypothetical protein [Chitinophaga polysaccharea]